MVEYFALRTGGVFDDKFKILATLKGTAPVA